MPGATPQDANKAASFRNSLRFSRKNTEDMLRVASMPTDELSFWSRSPTLDSSFVVLPLPLNFIRKGF
jgi:hypothetical protein